MPRYHKRRLQSQVQIWAADKLNRRNLIVYFVMVAIFVLILPVIVGWAVYSDYQRNILTDINEIPKGYSALVLGLDRNIADESMHNDLQGQVLAATDALNSGLVDQLVLTSATNNNSTLQTRTLGELAEAATHNDNGIQLDYAAHDVVEACSRAQTEFNLDQIVIFASFNTLTRALYACSALGMEVKGFVTDANMSVSDNPISAGVSMLGTIWQVNVAVPATTQ